MKKVNTTAMFKAFRAKCVPLVAISTNDPAATMMNCRRALNGKEDEVPLLEWDVNRGWTGINDAGKGSLGWYDPLAQSFPETLTKLVESAPPKTIAFIHNVQRFWDVVGVAQGLWNARDAFKQPDRKCMFVILAPSVQLPAELASDVMVINESIPDETEIAEVVDSVVESAKAQGGDVSKVNKAEVIGGLRGLLSRYDVEQTLSLATQRAGIDVAQIWERKIARLKETTTAEISINNPSFEAVCGCWAIKDELQAFANGKVKPGCVLYMDEIEKAFSGQGTELSGVKTGMIGMWLNWTQERRVRGFLLAGIPGTGKSWTAQCTAGMAGVPLFKLSMSEMQSSLVGSSEQRLRMALQAVDALAPTGVMLVASCNAVDQLTPEVMGRFTMGTYFYDFPTEEELLALTQYYVGQHGLPDDPESVVPLMRGWVGREVENVCFKAAQYGRPLKDCIATVAPSCIAQKAKLEALRRSCSERFNSASYPGVYKYREFVPSTVKVAAGRGFEFGKE